MLCPLLHWHIKVRKSEPSASKLGICGCFGINLKSDVAEAEMDWLNSVTVSFDSNLDAESKCS